MESKYQQLLVKQGMFMEDLHKSYKKYLKNLIEENFKNVTFKKLSRANGADDLCSNHLWSVQFDAMGFAWAKSKFNFRISSRSTVDHGMGEICAFYKKNLTNKDSFKRA